MEAVEGAAWVASTASLASALIDTDAAVGTDEIGTDEDVVEMSAGEQWEAKSKEDLEPALDEELVFVVGRVEYSVDSASRRALMGVSKRMEPTVARSESIIIQRYSVYLSPRSSPHLVAGSVLRSDRHDSHCRR